MAISFRNLLVAAGLLAAPAAAMAQASPATIVVYNAHHVPDNAFFAVCVCKVSQMPYFGHDDAPAARPVSWKSPYLTVAHHAEAPFLQFGDGGRQADPNISCAGWVWRITGWCRATRGGAQRPPMTLFIMTDKSCRLTKRWPEACE